MKNLLNLDNPMIQILNRVFDMIAVNILFLLSCIPVLTVGAAICGLNQAMQAIVLDDDRGVLKLYWQGFRRNFKQATLVWLGILLIMISLCCDYLLIVVFATGTWRKVLNLLLVVLAVLILSVVSYLYPLIVRYQNTIREHIYNAVILSLCKFPRTIPILLLNLFPFGIAWISLSVFGQTLVFWLTIGFSFLSYMVSHLLKPVFTQLEDHPE